MLEQFVLERHTKACVAIDRRLEIVHFFGPTDDYLKQPTGEARMDLLSWVPAGLYARLRAGLREAVDTTRKVTVTGMTLERGEAAVRVEASIEPVPDAMGSQDGLFLVSFRDGPEPARPMASADDEDADQPLVRQLEEELSDARLELQSSIEQLAMANEEYRASHEEMLSLNEELQSSNEELETSKEELQSLNEELGTTNRQLEERNAELRTVSADLNNLLVSAGIPILFLDDKLRIRHFTPACSQIMRIGPDDVGRVLADIKMQLCDEELLADVERILQAQEPGEAEVSANDDRWFARRVRPYREEEGRVGGVCVTFHDISVQKQAVADSEEARSFAEAIIRSSRTPLLVLNASLRVVSASQAFLDTFQVTEEVTRGRRIYELGNGQWDIPRLRVLLEEILPEREEVRHFDVEHDFETIGWRAMRVNGQLMTRKGRRDLVLVSIEDITDLRRAEMAAQRRSDELLQDHRRKDEFLAMLGHELRNPLAALANGVSVIKMAAADKERVLKVGEMMSRQTRRMSAMLDQLLDVARVISGKLELAQEAVDITTTVEAAIETVRPIVESGGHELSVTLPAEGTTLVLGDAVRLAQVVENLLANAAKYTDDHGHICLAVEASHDAVKLSVRDNGIGMEPEILEHAFDLFTQARQGPHRPKGGLGLGLPLVRSLVEMHRGYVQARSAGLGKGSEFVVSLPRLRSGRQSVVRQVEGQEVVPRRVLIVEDEPDAAAALAELLTLHGHEAHSVHHGEAALAAARSFRPEAVLLDLGLPEMDGYAVAQKLREEHGDQMLIVAVTGYQRDTARLDAAGFDAHLIKPPDPHRLLAMLSALGSAGGDRGS